MLSTLPDAITIAFVTFAVSVSLSQVFAKRNKYEITPNQVIYCIHTYVHTYMYAHIIRISNVCMYVRTSAVRIPAVDTK